MHTQLSFIKKERKGILKHFRNKQKVHSNIFVYRRKNQYRRIFSMIKLNILQDYKLGNKALAL